MAQVATTKAEKAAPAPEPKPIEVSPKQVHLNSEGYRWREFLVIMPANATADDLRTPGIFKRVMANRSTAFSALDRIFALADDWSWHAQCIVASASPEGAKLVVQKVGGFLEIDQSRLYRDSEFHVVFERGSFAVRRNRDDVLMSGSSFGTEAAAILEIRNLHPRQQSGGFAA